MRDILFRQAILQKSQQYDKQKTNFTKNREKLNTTILNENISLMCKMITTDVFSRIVLVHEHNRNN